MRLLQGKGVTEPTPLTAENTSPPIPILSHSILASLLRLGEIARRSCVSFGVPFIVTLNRYSFCPGIAHAL